MKKAIFIILGIGLAIQGLLMLTGGDGLPDALAAPTTAEKSRSKPEIKTRFAHRGLEPVGLRQKGRITVVEFFTTWCPGCKRMPGNYEYLLKHRPDVSIQRVQLADDYDFRRAADDFGVKLCGVPHITIFDAEGNLVSQDDCNEMHGTDLLFDWINAEIKNGAGNQRAG